MTPDLLPEGTPVIVEAHRTRLDDWCGSGVVLSDDGGYYLDVQIDRHEVNLPRSRIRRATH